MRPTPETKIYDAWGGEHAYKITPFGALEGVELLVQLGSIAGQPAGEGAQGIGLGALLGAGGDMEAVGDTRVNVPLLGKAASGLCLALMQAGATRLLIRILANTERRGDDGIWSKCGAEFNRIYQANYGELFQAVGWSLQVNYGSVASFPPLKALLSPETSNEQQSEAVALSAVQI